jgi:NADH:ubiquinone reductase (H+-translocating)
MTGETILDRNPYHQLLQEIHLVAAGFRTANKVQMPILKLIYRMNIKLIQSAVVAVIYNRSFFCLYSAM